MICANCGDTTLAGDRCEQCGEAPRLKERYELTDQLGVGAAGKTYRAHDADQGRDVAIKELAFHGLDSFKAHDLFEREADVLCRLEHHGIPTFYDRFAWGEGKALRFYLVMEYIDGHTLEAELADRQFSVDEVLGVLEEAGEIAGYLHSRTPPVIHRDIKPSNIMRRQDGSLVLVDFGSVRAALEPDDAGSTIAGTIGYMAPEQLRGVATTESDVYGLCAVALELTTRRDPVELLDSNNRLDWEPEDHSAPFARLLEKGLSPVPANRPTDGEALADHAAQLRATGHLDLTEPPSKSTDVGLYAPDSIDVHRSADELTFEIGWFSFVYLFLGFFALAWNSFLVAWYTLATSINAPWIFIVFPIAHVAVGVAITYVAVAGLFNSTEIRLDRRTLSVDHGPVPWPGGLSIDREQIRGFVTTERLKNNNTVYEVFAQLSGGGEKKLTGKLSEREESQFVARLLESELGAGESSRSSGEGSW